MMTISCSHGSWKSKVLMGMVGGLQRGPRMGRRPEGLAWAGWEQPASHLKLLCYLRVQFQAQVTLILGSTSTLGYPKAA